MLLAFLFIYGCSSQTSTETQAPPTTVQCALPLAAACVGDAAAGIVVDCPPAFASALPGPWCADNRSGAVSGSCGGYVVLAAGVGVDVTSFFMYPTDGGALSAVLAAVDNQFAGCIGGAAGFSLPLSCIGSGGENILSPFTGPGALPGCSTFDAGTEFDAGVDGGNEASIGDGGSDAAPDDGGDAGTDTD